jgi:hypothetical protein
MRFLDVIAERRIDEVWERGEFDNLPGSGAPRTPPHPSPLPRPGARGFQKITVI